MAERRSVRIGVAAASVLVLLAVIGLAFLKAPTSPPQVATGGVTGGSLPTMYEFTTDT
jgi:hypothetical protein